MTRDEILHIISDVEMMGGDTLADVVAPSELTAIVEALVQAGVVDGLRPEVRAFYGLDFLVEDGLGLGRIGIV